VAGPARLIKGTAVVSKHNRDSDPSSDNYNLRDESSQYTVVPNDVVERLCLANLGAHEIRVFWCLLRKTLGWRIDKDNNHLRKLTDQISLSQFQAMTGLDRRRVHEALTRLEKRRIISVLPGQDRQAKTYGINLTIAEWKLSYVARTVTKRGKHLNSVLPRQDSGSYVARTDVAYVTRTDLSYPDAHTKEYPKETYKEEGKESALSPSAFLEEATGKRFSDEDRKNQKELSELRNTMAKSRLYSDFELFEFKVKTLQELQRIHAERSVAREPLAVSQ
jgi:phage replication O-like protein O